MVISKWRPQLDVYRTMNENNRNLKKAGSLKNILKIINSNNELPLEVLVLRLKLRFLSPSLPL